MRDGLSPHDGRGAPGMQDRAQKPKKGDKSILERTTFQWSLIIN